MVSWWVDFPMIAQICPHILGGSPFGLSWTAMMFCGCTDDPIRPMPGPRLKFRFSAMTQGHQVVAKYGLLALAEWDRIQRAHQELLQAGPIHRCQTCYWTGTLKSDPGWSGSCSCDLLPVLCNTCLSVIHCHGLSLPIFRIEWKRCRNFSLSDGKTMRSSHVFLRI